jgi:hypothetical protein
MCGLVAAFHRAVVSAAPVRDTVGAFDKPVMSAIGMGSLVGGREIQTLAKTGNKNETVQDILREPPFNRALDGYSWHCRRLPGPYNAAV